MAPVTAALRRPVPDLAERIFPRSCVSVAAATGLNAHSHAPIWSRTCL